MHTGLDYEDSRWEGRSSPRTATIYKQSSEDEARLWWTARWSVVRQAPFRYSLGFQVALSTLCLAVCSCPHLCAEPPPQAAAGHILPLGSFIICASKACKFFTGSVPPQYQDTSLGPCPVLWESAIESTLGLSPWSERPVTKS